jgi:hypothetical protein
MKHSMYFNTPQLMTIFQFILYLYISCWKYLLQDISIMCAVEGTQYQLLNLGMTVHNVFLATSNQNFSFHLVGCLLPDLRSCRTEICKVIRLSRFILECCVTAKQKQGNFLHSYKPKFPTFLQTKFSCIPTNQNFLHSYKPKFHTFLQTKISYIPTNQNFLHSYKPK